MKYPPRDLMTEEVDSTLQGRLSHPNLIQHGCETAHRARRTRPCDIEKGLATNQQRAAQHLLTVALVYGNRLAGEDRLIEHRAMDIVEHTVGRHAITSFEPHAVARHDRLCWKVHEPPVAKHPGLSASQCFQARECRLGPLFLI